MNWKNNLLDNRVDFSSPVQDIMDRYPQTSQVFVALRTACVGCSMSRFCGLDDVAHNYNLELAFLQGELLKLMV